MPIVLNELLIYRIEGTCHTSGHHCNYYPDVFLFKLSICNSFDDGSPVD